MTLPVDVLHSLICALGGPKPPRVRALHLPADPWDGSRDGEFGALELEDGSLGLSYVLLDGACPHSPQAGRVTHKAEAQS